MTATFLNKKIKTLNGLIVSKEPNLGNDRFTMSGVAPAPPPPPVTPPPVGVSPPGGGGGIEARRLQRLFASYRAIEEPLSTKTD